MTILGWIFKFGSWLIVAVLTFYSLFRVMAIQRKKRDENTAAS